MRIPKRHKLCALLTAGAMAAASLTGSATAAFGASSSVVSIQYWTNDTNPVEAQIVAEFNKTHPDIDVHLTAYATAAYLAALATAASDRKLPDVFFEGLGATLAHEYEDAGLVYNLTPYAKQLGWATQFSALSQKLLNYEGKWWEEPLYNIALGVFYRKDIFAKLHIGVPTTFAQFVSDLAIIKKAGDTPMSLGGETYYLPMRFFDGLLQYYGKNGFFTELGERKVSWDSKPVIEAFTTLRQWTVDDYFTPGFLSIPDTNDNIPFFAGYAAMVLEGSFEDATINSVDQPMKNYGFFPFPEDESPDLLSTFSQGMMIGANTAHIQAALTFMEFYGSAANLKQHASVLTQPDARLSVSPPASQPNAREMASLIDKEGIGYLPTDQLLPQPLVNAFSTAQAADITGTMTPTATAQYLAKAVASYKGTWPWGNGPVP